MDILGQLDNFKFAAAAKFLTPILTWYNHADVLADADLLCILPVRTDNI